MDRYSPDVAPRYMLFYQLARITKSKGALKHDDRLDALAIAVKYFQEALLQDQTNAQKQRDSAAFDKYLADFRAEFNMNEGHATAYHKRVHDNIKQGR